MGKAIRWFKSLLSSKKPSNPNQFINTQSNVSNVGDDDKRWSFGKAVTMEEKSNEQSKHAIAVAAATAAAADAAVAAAQAAAAVVRLTSQGSRGALFSGSSEILGWAAVRIQSFFRGYLARRAHRALKGLVKLQAHVRGYLVRKQAAATLHSMQALIRAQSTVRSLRASNNQPLAKTNKSQSDFRSRRSLERLDEAKNEQIHSNRVQWTSCDPYNSCTLEGSPKIVEIDTYNKPKSRSRRMNNNTNNNNKNQSSMYDFGHEDYFQYPMMSSPLPSVQGAYDWSYYEDVVEGQGQGQGRVCTAQTTPRFNNVAPTPTRSVCGDGGGVLFRHQPGYMGDTKSFRAKLRSQSAPKQRPVGRVKKGGVSLDEIMGSRNSVSGGGGGLLRMQRSYSHVQESLNF